ncbi:ankyrin repeat domain-containing protein [Aspergillus affinis]|uniref:ankyrin repeat domain-containing protein n=1 Tax=Aspergillus affinis TaxID=1070780 RepID=UPI0022FED26C|nr:uncharacterized protein KD926_010198 [Aspergillus affinis]KAI9038865.1 hypothetical protein KD926_010198 [Aspergillus affinis]
MSTVHDIDNEFLLRRILVWTHFAERKLTAWELQHAVSIDPNSQEGNLVDVPDLDRMKDVSNGMLVLDESTGVFEVIGGRSLQYLATRMPDVMANTQTDIARACVAYLKFRVFQRGMCNSDGEFETRQLANAFHEYAACYWGHHVREAGLQAQKATQLMSDIEPNWDRNPRQSPVNLTNFSFREYRALKQEVLRFLGGGPCFWAAVQTLKSIGPYHVKMLATDNGRLKKDQPVLPQYSQKVPDGMTGMHVAAWFGLADIIPGLVESEMHPDTKSSCGRTPLSLAASNGHRKTVSILVTKYRADPRSKADRGFTPLHFAACGGHADVVQYLTDIGVDVDSYSDYGLSALSCAAMYAKEEVVRMLLNKGANVNSVEFVGHQTPLIFGVIGCSVFVVQMLLQRAALVDAEDRSGRTALGYAADLGCEIIARMLYEAIIGDPKVLDRHHSLYGEKPLTEYGRVLMKGIVGQYKR